MTGRDGQPQPHFHKYSSWLIHALWQRALATGDFDGLVARYPLLLADYRAWQRDKRLESGLYWQHDVWDAMEESISGSRRDKHIRPTINSYMYGNAVALAAIARLAGDAQTAAALDAEAEQLRRLVLDTLWNADRAFFEVVREEGGFAHVREAIGFIPWYFNLPPDTPEHGSAWAQLTNPDGFRAPWGITTAERRHPEFRSHGVGTCEWDGAVWPFATSQTLTALANVLRGYTNAPVAKTDYMDAFLTYTRSQYYAGLPYIGEYHDETTGQWLKGRDPRSYYYHHSTYADLLVTGLAGLRPRADGIVEVDPLLPDDSWNWFCLDGIPYRGHALTILWDRHGRRYGRGPGLHLLIDGVPAASAAALTRIEGALPAK
jgi:hypothetical protein